MGDEDTWYSKLREKYKPSKVKLLLIGESAPSSNELSRRFFYAPVSPAARQFVPRGCPRNVRPSVSAR